MALENADTACEMVAMQAFIRRLFACRLLTWLNPGVRVRGWGQVERQRRNKKGAKNTAPLQNLFLFLGRNMRVLVRSLFF